MAAILPLSLRLCCLGTHVRIVPALSTSNILRSAPDIRLTPLGRNPTSILSWVDWGKPSSKAAVPDTYPRPKWAPFSSFPSYIFPKFFACSSSGTFGTIDDSFFIRLRTWPCSSQSILFFMFLGDTLYTISPAVIPVASKSTAGWTVLSVKDARLESQLLFTSLFFTRERIPCFIRQAVHSVRGSWSLQTSPRSWICNFPLRFEAKSYHIFVSLLMISPAETAV